MTRTKHENNEKTKTQAAQRTNNTRITTLERPVVKPTGSLNRFTANKSSP